MLDAVLDELVKTINGGGLTCVREFPSAPPKDSSLICVGLKSGKFLSSGCGEYLGMVEENGVMTEKYGLRLELVIGLAIYSDSAAGCPRLYEGVSNAMANPPSGLKIRALVCGQTEYGEDTGLYRCDCEVHCVAYLIRSAGKEAGEFTDFVLRGAMK